MTILDQVKKLTPGHAAKVAHRAELDATYDALQAARKVAADLQVRFSDANSALDVAETEMRTLALAAFTDPAASASYEKAKGVVKAKKDELEKIASAQLAADAAVQTALRNLRTVAHSDRVAEQKRIGNQRLKCATEIVALVAALHAAHTKFVEVGIKSIACWPDRNFPQRAVSYERECFDALTHEFARVSGRGALPQRGEAPQLPGSAYPWQAGSDRTKIMPLTEVIEKANAFLLTSLDALPLPDVGLPATEIGTAEPVMPSPTVTVTQSRKTAST
jgi:hypothetical protein